MSLQTLSRERGIYHLYSRRRTYVTKVSGLKLLSYRFNRENFKGKIEPTDMYYIQCDRFGNFDWINSQVYSSHSLVGMDNVFIVNNDKKAV